MTLSRSERQRIDRIARGRSADGLFLLEGPRAVLDALTTGAVVQLWLRDDLAPQARGALEQAAAAAGVALGRASAADFSRLARTVTPQGALALVRETARPLADVVSLPGMLLWLDGLQDPGNVGALVRVAAGLGAAGLLLSSGGAHPLGFKALRASAGLALRVPFARADPDAIAEAVARRPCWLLERGGEDLLALAQVPGDLVLVVGSEGSGAGPAATQRAVRTVGIALAPGVDSLNAAVAAGIAVAVLLRAQGMRP